MVSSFFRGIDGWYAVHIGNILFRVYPNFIDREIPCIATMGYVGPSVEDSALLKDRATPVSWRQLPVQVRAAVVQIEEVVGFEVQCLGHAHSEALADA